MVRTRAALLAVAAGLLVGCQDARLPTDAEPGMMPQISDGEHSSGNSHFFFLPPMVPSPSFSGTFNGSLAPEVKICEFDEPPVDEDPALFPGCGVEGRVFPTGADPIIASLVEGSEHYIFHWQTDTFNLKVEKLYRVFVSVIGENLGFADIDVEATTENLKDVDETRLVPLLIDRTLPIKFRIEVGALCVALNIAPDKCAEGVVDLALGGTVALNDAGVDIPLQTEIELGLHTLIIRSCDLEDFPIDLPRFGPCLDITTEPEMPTLPATSLAIVFVCSDGFATISDVADDYKDAPLASRSTQELLLTVHRLDDDGSVEALPHATVVCGDVVGAVPDANPLIRFARAGWNSLRNVFAPEPLHAKFRRGDEGPGGEAGEFSRFQFALPAQMTRIAGTESQVAGPGEEVPISPGVLVTDGEGQPVAGARVTFEITGDDGTGLLTCDPQATADPRCETEDEDGNVTAATTIVVKTGPNGLASVPAAGIGQLTSWRVGLVAGVDNFLDASGFGIATGIQSAFNPFLSATPNAGITLPSAAPVTFKAFVCNNFDIMADGGLGETEWTTNDPSSTRTFTAKLSKGGSATATVRVMNDCDNLYIALTVERPEADDVNVLRVDFDNDGDGVPAEGDDVWKLEAIAGGSVVTDGFLTSRCFRGGKQAECFTDDKDVEGGHNDVNAGHGFAGGLSIYEFKHALSTGDTRLSDDLLIDVNLDRSESTFGMFFTLSQSPSAKGAKGNTQWPGFRLYLQCTTATPEANSSALSCTVQQEQ